MNSVELMEQRARHIVDARKIIDTADAEKRELNAEESEKVDQHFAEADKLEAKIDTQNKREAVEAAEARLKTVSERKSRPTLHHQDEPAQPISALRSWLSYGAISHNKRPVRLTGADIDNAQRCGLDLSSRTASLRTEAPLLKGSATAGAELVAWSDFYAGFYDKLKYYGPCLDLVTIQNSDNGNSLHIPVMDDTGNIAEVLAEGSEAAEGEPVTAKVTLGSFKYSSKEVIVSLELLQDSSFDLESYIVNALAVRFGRKWNADITKGAGSTLPYGLAARASSASIVSGGSAATPTLTADNLFDLADAVDDSYRNAPGVGYMMSRTTWSKVRKLKDDENRYLIGPDLQAGTRAMFNGYPVYINPDMDSAGVSKKIVLFGDYKMYTWRKVSGIELHRLNEHRIRSGEVSFLAFARADGNLINTDAVKYIASPAS